MSKRPYGFILLGDTTGEPLSFVSRHLESIHYPTTAIIPGQKPVDDIAAGAAYAIFTDPRYLETAVLVARGVPVVVVDEQFNPGIRERADITDYLVLSHIPEQRNVQLWNSLRRLGLDSLRGRHLLRTVHPVALSYAEPASSSGK